MSTLAELFSQVWAQRLGWTLIHFVWEGGVIALLLAGALRLMPSAHARHHYLMAACALAACAAAPFLTWIACGDSLSLPAPHSVSISTLTPAATSSPAHAAEHPSPAPITFATVTATPHLSVESAIPWIVLAWLAGVVCLSLRLVAGWLWLRRLRLSGTALEDIVILDRFHVLAHRMSVSRPVELLTSALVEVPTLIGWLRPVILVPVSVLAGLSPDQIEAVLAHELAHVRRWDYLVNLLQTAVETVLFYHPAVWWISHIVREERENCCDDIVLQGTASPHLYASALAFIEEVRPLPFALSAGGGSLLQRIRRMGGTNPEAPSVSPLLVVGFVIIAAGVTSLWASGDKKAQPPILALSDKRYDQLYNGVRLEGLKIVNMPLDQFVTMISKQLAAADPLKQGFTFVLHIPPGEKPIPVSLDFARLPHYRANLGMILDPLHRQFPLRYHTDGAIVYIEQYPQAEVVFTTKAAATLIDIDFHGADPRVALSTIRQASAAQGFPFDLNLDSASSLSKIDLSAHGISVDQALRSILYLADLKPQPLVPFTGYKVVPLSPEEAKKEVYFQLGDESFSTTDLNSEEADFQSRCKMHPEWSGPSLNGPTFGFSKGGTPNSGAVQKEPVGNKIFEHHCNVTMAILDKRHLRLHLEYEVTDETGNILGKVTGEDVVESGTRVWLAAQGKPAIVIPANGPQEPARGFIDLAQATLLDRDGHPLLPWPGVGKEIASTTASAAAIAPFFQQVASGSTDNARALTVRTFLAPPNFFKTLPPSPDEVKKELSERGILFPTGATAVLLSDSRKLVVRNTPEQLDLLAKLIDSAAAAPPAPVDSKSAWVVGAWSPLVRPTPPESPPAPPISAGPVTPDITVTGHVLIVPSAQVDFSKSSGTLTYIDGRVHDFSLKSDGSFEVDHLLPGPYDRTIHLVQKAPALGPPAVERYLLAQSVLVENKPHDPVTMLINAGDPFRGPDRDTMVSVELRLVEMDDSVYQANRAVIDAGLDRGDDSLVLALNNMKGVDLVTTPSVSTHPGLKADIEIVREFPYPTSFEKSKSNFQRVNGGMTLIPPTPREFVTKNIGITARITPTLDNDVVGNAPSHPENGKIVLNGELEVTDFEGFIKSNLAEHINMPSFETKESNFIEALDDGQWKGFWIPERYTEETITDTDAVGKKTTTTVIVKKRRLLLLTANLVR